MRFTGIAEKQHWGAFGSITIVNIGSATVGAFMAALPGFISQENGVSVQEDGISPGHEWFVIVRWDSLENAQAAAKALNASPETSAAMMKSMKADQIFFRHYHRAGLTESPRCAPSGKLLDPVIFNGLILRVGILSGPFACAPILRPRGG